MVRHQAVAALISWWCSLCVALPFDSTYEDENLTMGLHVPSPPKSFLSTQDYVAETLARSETAGATSGVLPVFWDHLKPSTTTYQMTNSFTIPRPACGGDSVGEFLCILITYASIAAVCAVVTTPLVIMMWTILQRVMPALSKNNDTSDERQRRPWWSLRSEQNDEERRLLEPKAMQHIDERLHDGSLKAA